MICLCLLLASFLKPPGLIIMLETVILVFKGLRVSHNVGDPLYSDRPKRVIPLYSIVSITVSLPLSHSHGRLQWTSRVWKHHHSSQSSGAHNHFHEAIQQGRCCRAFESSHKLLPSFTSPPQKPLSYAVKVNSLLQHGAPLGIVVLGLFSQEKQIKVAPATTQH